MNVRCGAPSGAMAAAIIRARGVPRGIVRICSAAAGRRQCGSITAGDAMAEARQPSSSLDAVLEPFARAATDAESEELLARVLREHADPIIREILVYKTTISAYGSSRQL